MRTASLPARRLRPSANGRRGCAPMRSPKWIVGHAVVVVAVAVCATLGFWQLDRRSERRAENARIKERIARPAPLDPSGFTAGSTEALRYRGVETVGRYDPAHEFLVRYRT